MKTQFSRFLLVGVLNSLLGYLIIFGCMYVLKISPEVSNLIGYSVGLALSFVLNRTFTFRSSGKQSGELIRFLAVFTVAYGANLAVLYLLVRILLIHAGISQVIAGVVYVIFTYFMNKSFVFRQSRSSHGVKG